MKKSNKPDIHQKQGLELSKKLYRATTDHAKRLDDARSCARTIRDLFSPTVQIQRRKFCEYCERLMFSDPSLYGKKAEELLWRKGFYELFTTAKKLKKNEYSQDDVSSIETHILSGVGFYHHLIGRIQQEFEMNLVNVVDFPLKTSEGGESATEWAEGAIHQCLIYLGDLNRYKLEIYPTLEPSLAFRYYLQAISYKPDHGMPHNQMGTLAISQNKFIDAVYYYMRCLACVNTFEGTVNNLHNLFEKLPLENPENFKSFVANFLSLIDVWYFNKKAKVYTLCHQTYKDLEECLNMKSSEPCVSPAETDSTDSTPELLNSDLIFKITTICLLCLHKLQKSNSNQASTAVAFTLAIYSQLVQSVTNHIQDSVLNYPIADDAKIEPNGVVKDLFKKKNASKLRRRKVIASDSDEESDDDLNLSSDSESFEENVLAESSDDETETNDDKTIDVYRKVKLIDVNDSLEIITEEGTLKSIKVINDWLRHDLDVVKSCGTNTRSLFKQITNLLNLINVNVKSPKLRGINLNVVEIIKGENVIPLPEDVVLKGVEMLSKAHKNVDWNYLQKTGVDVKEESVIRIVKFLAFGKFLTTIEETGISFDERANMFVCKCEENEQQAQNVIVEELEELHEVENGPVITSKYDDKETENKGQLMKMKHMGQLWLASEVRALESRVRGKTSLSPYLVLDADALIKYTFMVKHLVHSRKFIVVIPSAVVSALDDLKREQSEARDAIRWLESQFHRGNRFFRAQRPQEKAAIPFIKYPKKKDKEMSTYIHIIECCYFLYEQQKGASNLVTLLIGNQNILTNGENKEFSYVGLAQSAGISIESITEFYGKWKKSYKGKR